jgi:hypothetical protein
MKRYKRLNLGSVSHATMREEDLIPAFISELRAQTPCKRAHRKLIREIEARMESETYFEDEDSPEDLAELFNALEEYCLPYFYFGAHPGDGSDYGYWLSENFEEDFDGLKVSDLSEVPTGFSGEVLHVSDHGNPSLYAYSRGRRRAVWSLV